jgi:hypothetical protein
VADKVLHVRFASMNLSDTEGGQFSDAKVDDMSSAVFQGAPSSALDTAAPTIGLGGASGLSLLASVCSERAFASDVLELRAAKQQQPPAPVARLFGAAPVASATTSSSDAPFPSPQPHAAHSTCMLWSLSAQSQSNRC